MRLKKIFFFNLLIIFTLFLTGCEKKDYTKEPPKLHWDRDMCERCKMAISDRKFAVEAIGEDGKVYRFDDIGCLILWQNKEHPEIRFKKIWIKDAKSGKWIDAKKAKYTTDSITPMGYGFAAFNENEKPENKEIIDYEEVKRRVIKIGR
ncbi:nitrous oxide reductase accessory protein NosL [Nitrosophilus labii]|uniref:nitrous oxide reductase accessory protein NosL n=1 Tax=Nitrosophilus labii TaxID=2706014 RepID=UPI001656A878|nr:nitrous oxide reductase accessory protein NosL [Nitrosophilus labii]